MTEERGYVVLVIQEDTQTGRSSRYYIKRADDDRRVAIVNKNVANHLVANLGNTWCYRYHGIAIPYDIAFEEIVA